MILVKIRFFLVAAKHLHFSAAAAELQITQTALSTTIRQLEEGFGVILFERVAKSVILTRFGELLTRRARDNGDRGDQMGTGGILHVGAVPM